MPSSPTARSSEHGQRARADARLDDPGAGEDVGHRDDLRGVLGVDHRGAAGHREHVVGQQRAQARGRSFRRWTHDGLRVRRSARRAGRSPCACGRSCPASSVNVWWRPFGSVSCTWSPARKDRAASARDRARVCHGMQGTALPSPGPRSTSASGEHAVHVAVLIDHQVLRGRHGPHPRRQLLAGQVRRQDEPGSSAAGPGRPGPRADAPPAWRSPPPR